ncbi:MULTISPECIES: hypothetical protein [unclassified Haematobacter]|uniref:hypothetical protein n=1 Tax=unclassified Haematobacter TaxID=2640585 RepID=UPI0025C643DC|nr:MULTISPECIES: hypothetical protein [unclassified Haematobacter]
MSEKLNDDQVYERLHAALIALGAQDGETVRGDTAIKTARRAMLLLQLGLLSTEKPE